MASSADLTKVTLDWITPDAEKVIARHARVSTENPDKSEYAKLLSFCLRQGHFSVFEQATVSFEIITSRAIAAQLLRHRSAKFQEFSQRYSDPLNVLDQYSADCWQFELRKQDKTNRQNSLPFDDDEIEARFRPRIKEAYDTLQALYADMIEAGVAKESARFILPLCVPTRLHMNNDVRNWIFYVGLRSAPGTQKEHKIISNRIGQRLRALLPTVSQAVCEVAAAGNNPALTGWLHIDEI